MNGDHAFQAISTAMSSSAAGPMYSLLKRFSCGEIHVSPRSRFRVQISAPASANAATIPYENCRKLSFHASSANGGTKAASTSLSRLLSGLPSTFAAISRANRTR